MFVFRIQFAKFSNQVITQNMKKKKVPNRVNKYDDNIKENLGMETEIEIKY